jgi:twitching motility protein PilI
VGADNWFVALHQVSEVIPVPPMVQVPRTQPWFRGVANVRGNLYSMVGLLRLPGPRRDRPGHGEARDPGFGALVGGAGLLVSRMLGLRNPEQFNSRLVPSRPPRLGGGGLYRCGRNAMA